MRLTMIGTGTAAPHPARVQSGVLLEHDEFRLLVDCGSGVVARMAQLGAGWAGITHVALTHFHADHCADLPNLAFAWRYGMSPPREQPVAIVGPEGTRSLADSFGALYRLPVVVDAPPTSVTEVAPGEACGISPSFTLDAFKVPHTPESVAWAVTGGGVRVVISGDTGFDEGFAEWAAGSDILVLECSLPDESAMGIHLTPSTCAAIAAIAQPRALVLTHFYPPVEEVDIAAAIAARYPGPVTLATDGWTTGVGR